MDPIIYTNLNNNNMPEIHRNTILNYLNDNKIDYKFDQTDQTIECHYWWTGKLSIKIN